MSDYHAILKFEGGAVWEDKAITVLVNPTNVWLKRIGMFGLPLYALVDEHGKIQAEVIPEKDGHNLRFGVGVCGDKLYMADWNPPLGANVEGYLFSFFSELAAKFNFAFQGEWKDRNAQ